MPLHLASSSAIGLSDLYFYLRYMASKEHLLIVVEPESHLDTANQIQFARVLARFVDMGIKVLVTTHSDYLIKRDQQPDHVEPARRRRTESSGDIDLPSRS